MESVFNEEEQNEIIDLVHAVLPKQESKKISRVDAKYNDDVEKILNLLSASIVTPNGEQSTKVQLLISDEHNRIELENYVMNLTRKNLSKKIKVNKEGF